MELNTEKIKKGLESCTVYGGCFDCAYKKKADGRIDTECKAKMCRDALELIDHYEQKIKELTEKSERAKGSWQISYTCGLHYECTACKYKVRAPYAPFCPSCGADMRKEGKK